MKVLRHLKNLTVSFNAITGESVQEVCKIFGQVRTTAPFYTLVHNRYTD
jgi:hypothetical protein